MSRTDGRETPLSDAPSAIAADVTQFFEDYAAKNPKASRSARRCIEILNSSSDGYVAARNTLTRLRQSRGKSGPLSEVTSKQLDLARQAMLLSRSLKGDERERLLAESPREIAQVLESGDADLDDATEQLLKAIGLAQTCTSSPRVVQYRGTPAMMAQGSARIVDALTPRERQAHELLRSIGLHDVARRIYDTPTLTPQQAFDMLVERLRGPAGDPFRNAEATGIVLHVLHDRYSTSPDAAAPKPEEDAAKKRSAHSMRDKLPPSEDDETPFSDDDEAALEDVIKEVSAEKPRGAEIEIEEWTPSTGDKT